VKRPKLLSKALAKNANLRFEEMTRLVESFGFHLARVSGSHHIYTHPDIPDLLNLQESNGKAKPYQVRQFLRIVERYNLGIGDGP
jgi:predicted RNA binding protein YcfA (HicA-like mRNA interferase family)